MLFRSAVLNFPLLFTSMIETGEASGSLDVVMENLAQHYEKEHKLKQKIKTAMTYPTMVLLVALGVIYFPADHCGAYIYWNLHTQRHAASSPNAVAFVLKRVFYQKTVY